MRKRAISYWGEKRRLMLLEGMLTPSNNLCRRCLTNSSKIIRPPVEDWVPLDLVHHVLPPCKSGAMPENKRRAAIHLAAAPLAVYAIVSSRFLRYRKSVVSCKIDDWRDGEHRTRLRMTEWCRFKGRHPLPSFGRRSTHVHPHD